ncbi:MAG: homoserine kinase [Planctomycetota bacterium]
MAKPTPITFHVPASAANLGPGYGVVGLALDLPLGITVEPRSDGELIVERRDDPSAHLEDPRHDPVLRGLRRGAELFGCSLAKGVSITVEGTIPRGTGMGTISASYAAGIGIAARMAKKRPSADLAIDAMIPLGADSAHGAAALLGGLTVTTQLSLPQESEVRHRLLPHPVHTDWHYVIALPDLQMGTADTKRVLPPTLPHAATRRSTSRTLGVLRALAEADEDLLRACLPDEIHLPYRRRLVPGLDEALHAAVAAGAAGATICGHGPGLIAFTTVPGRVPEIAKGLVHAFAQAGREATTLTLQTAFYGAFPAAPSSD